MIGYLIEMDRLNKNNRVKLVDFLVIDGKYIPYSDESFFDVSPMDFDDPINRAAVKELYTNALDPNTVYKVIEI